MAWSSPALYQLVDSEIENGLKEERGREGRRDGERKRRKRAGGEEESPDGVEGELRQKVEGREDGRASGSRQGEGGRGCVLASAQSHPLRNSTFLLESPPSSPGTEGKV